MIAQGVNTGRGGVTPICWGAPMQQSTPSSSPSKGKYLKYIPQLSLNILIRWNSLPSKMHHFNLRQYLLELFNIYQRLPLPPTSTSISPIPALLRNIEKTHLLFLKITPKKECKEVPMFLQVLPSPHIFTFLNPVFSVPFYQSGQICNDNGKLDLFQINLNILLNFTQQECQLIQNRWTNF